MSEQRGDMDPQDECVYMTEGRMAQYEDRLDKRKSPRVDISELLTGKSKERWIARWGMDKKI